MPTIEMKGLEQTLNRLAWEKGARMALPVAAKYVQGKAAQYPAVKRPPRKSVYGKTFQSDRQRRKVMAMLRQGLWPYRRTGTLGRRWTMRVAPATLTAWVGNNTPYAPMVQDTKGQSKYHQVVGWKTTQAVADETQPEVERMFKIKIDEQLAGGK